MFHAKIAGVTSVSRTMQRCQPGQIPRDGKVRAGTLVKDRAAHRSFSIIGASVSSELQYHWDLSNFGIPVPLGIQYAICLFS